MQVDYTKRPNITQLLQYVHDRLTQQYNGGGNDGADGWSEYDNNGVNSAELSDDETVSDDGDCEQQDSGKIHRLKDLSKNNEDQEKCVNNENMKIASSDKSSALDNLGVNVNCDKPILRPPAEVKNMASSDNNVSQKSSKIANNIDTDTIKIQTYSDNTVKNENKEQDRHWKYKNDEVVPSVEVADGITCKVVLNSKHEKSNSKKNDNNISNSNELNTANTSYWNAQEAKKLQEKKLQEKNKAVEISDDSVDNVLNLGDLGRKKIFSIVPSEKLLGDVTKTNLLPGPSADTKIEGMNVNKKALNARNVNPIEQLLKNAKELVPTYPIVNDAVAKPSLDVKLAKIAVASSNMIDIDANRVQILLKKELSVLRKLLQTREMLSATVLTVLNKKNNFSTDKESENELKEQTVNINNKIAKENISIQDKIVTAQDR